MKINDEKKLNMETPDKKKERMKTVLYWVILNLGIFLLAAGIFLFKSPNNFATGGVSGISIILTKYVTKSVPFMTQPIINLIINAVLIIIGFIFLGRGCTFRTAYCSIMYTLEMYAMQWIF